MPKDEGTGFKDGFGSARTGEDEAAVDSNQKAVEGGVTPLEEEMGWEMMEDEAFMILYKTSPTEQGPLVRNEMHRVAKTQGPRPRLINGLRALMSK